MRAADRDYAPGVARSVDSHLAQPDDVVDRLPVHAIRRCDVLVPVALGVREATEVALIVGHLVPTHQAVAGTVEIDAIPAVRDGIVHQRIVARFLQDDAAVDVVADGAVLDPRTAGADEEHAVAVVTEGLAGDGHVRATDRDDTAGGLAGPDRDVGPVNEVVNRLAVDRVGLVDVVDVVGGAVPDHTEIAGVVVQVSAPERVGQAVVDVQTRRRAIHDFVVRQHISGGTVIQLNAHAGT